MGKDSLVTLAQKNQIDPLYKVSKAFLADRQILPSFSEALPSSNRNI